ncbi:MAG: CHAT domain-containing protein [Alphaproteobacteria bacterium]|nr:CHAT domain-containing protein [Alphaproteobacteria bacterium]NKC02278.1 CHAT domain-containing protein [Pseudomonadales bacterium]
MVHTESNKWPEAIEAFQRVTEVYTNARHPIKWVAARGMQAMCLLKIGSIDSLTQSREIALELKELRPRRRKFEFDAAVAMLVTYVTQYLIVSGIRDEQLEKTAEATLTKVAERIRPGRPTSLEIEFRIFEGLMDLCVGLLEFDQARQETGNQILEIARDDALKIKNKELLQKIGLHLAQYHVLQTKKENFSLKSLGMARISVDEFSAVNGPLNISVKLNILTAANLDSFPATNQYGKIPKSKINLSILLKDIEKANVNPEVEFFEKLAARQFEDGHVKEAKQIVEYCIDKFYYLEYLTKKDKLLSLSIFDKITYLNLYLMSGKIEQNISTLEWVLTTCKNLEHEYLGDQPPALIIVMIKTLTVDILDGMYAIKKSVYLLKEQIDILESIISILSMTDFRSAKVDLQIGLTSKLITLSKELDIFENKSLQEKLTNSLESCLYYLNDDNLDFVSFSDRAVLIHRMSKFGDILAYLYLRRGKSDHALLSAHQTRSTWLSSVFQENDKHAGSGEGNVLRDARVKWQDSTENLENFVAANLTNSKSDFSETLLELIEEADDAHYDYKQQATSVQNTQVIPVAFEFVQSLVCDLPEKAVLLIPIVTVLGGAVIIVRSHASPGDYAILLGSEAILVPELTEAWVDRLTGDSTGMSKIRSLLAKSARSSIEGKNDASLWLGHANRLLESIATEIWDVLFAAIDDSVLKVSDLDQLFIFAPGKLTLLPLHAACREEPTTGLPRYLIQDCAVSYWPSLSKGAQGAERKASTSETLVVKDPTDDLKIDLGPLEEDDNSLVIGKGRALTGTLKDVREALPAAAQIIFHCHGKWDARNPTNNGIVLADGVLTLQDIRNLDLSEAETIVLAACDSGLIESNRTPNEFLGLPSSFLEAGAGSVVSSLWPVTESVSRQIIASIHSGRGNADSPSMSVKSVQNGLLRRKGSLADRTSAIDGSEDNYGQWVARTPAAPIHWASFFTTTTRNNL